MNRFQELSELVEKGGVDESFYKEHEREVINETDTDAGRLLVESTEKVAAIDLSQASEYLDGKSDATLLEVVAAVEETEAIVDSFLELGYPNRWYLSKSAEVIGISKRLDSRLEGEQTSLRQEFVSKKEQLEERKKDFASCTSLRKAMDSLADDYAEVHEVAERRGLKIDEEAEMAFADYTPKRKKTGECKKRIDALYERYRAVDKTDSPLHELKQLRKETRTGWRKSQLAKDCMDAKYYEGALRLKDLGDDINLIIKDFGYYRKLKDEINSGISRVEVNAKAVDEMGSRSLSLANLKTLKQFQDTTNPGEYSRHAQTIFLEEEVLEYKESAAKLAKMVSELIGQEIERLNSRYIALKSRTENTPKSMSEVSEYISLVTGMHEELEGVKMRYEAVGCVGGTTKIDALSRGNRARIGQLKETREAYESVRKTREEVTSLGDNIRQGLNPDNIDTLARLRERPKVSSQAIENAYLREEYSAEVKALDNDIRSLASSCINTVDQMYREAEKDKAYDVGYVLALYTKINAITDVTSRIERVKALAEKRKAEDDKVKIARYEAKIADMEAVLSETTGMHQQHVSGYEKAISALKAEQQKLEHDKALSQRSSGKLRRRVSELEGKLKGLQSRQSYHAQPTQPPKDSDLSSYLGGAGEPETFPILRLVNSLRSSDDWTQRFHNFRQQLGRLHSTFNQRDIAYLSGVHSAIKTSIEDGELSKYLGSDKRRLREATGVVSALHDYIEKSRELVKSEATHV